MQIAMFGGAELREMDSQRGISCTTTKSAHEIARCERKLRLATAARSAPIEERLPERDALRQRPTVLLSNTLSQQVADFPGDCLEGSEIE